MDLSRRGFLRGLAGAAAVAVLAPVVELVARETLPRIVGDGIHDDTAGLQAAIDGKPFASDVVKVIDRDGWRTVVLGSDEYRISKALELADTRNLIIDGGTLVTDADYCVEFKGFCRNVWMTRTNLKFLPQNINPTARAMQISYGGAV